jgi:hypothetical protein
LISSITLPASVCVSVGTKQTYPTNCIEMADFLQRERFMLWKSTCVRPAPAPNFGQYWWSTTLESKKMKRDEERVRIIIIIKA